MKIKLYIFITFVSLTLLSIAPTASASTNDVIYNDGIITVTGLGCAPPRAFSRPYAMIYARQAATLDAYRLLAEYLYKNPTQETTVATWYKGMIIDKTTFNTEAVHRLIKHIKITSIKYYHDGGVEVTIQASVINPTQFRKQINTKDVSP